MFQKIALVIGVIVGLLVVGAMIKPGPAFFIGMYRYDTRSEGNLKPGMPAPDVELVALDGSKVHLKDRIAGKPLVIIFGSFT